MDQKLEDISKGVNSFIAASPFFQDWPECQQILMNLLVNDKPWVQALPVLSYQAVGGKDSAIIPVAAAWTTLVHAANLIDDIQDGDLIRSAQLERPESAITIAIAWIFAAFQMIEDSALDQATKNQIITILARAGFDSSMGQFQDLTIAAGQSKGIDQLQAYWSAVILKSGSVSMAGTASGAAVGTNSTLLIEALSDYGTALGVIKQVMDDCRDIWVDSNNKKGPSTLPIILDSMVAGQLPGKPRIVVELSKISPTDLQTETSKSLTETGIPEIIADILLEWRRRALESLQVLNPSEAREELANILEHVLNPNSPMT